MKKIFNIVSGNPSGALNISMEISEYLKQCGFDVIDIFRKYNKTKYKNVVVIKDKCTIDYIVSLSNFIKKNKPDLVIVHGYSTHIWTKLALAYAKIPVKLIHVEHNTEKYTPFRRYLTQKLDKYTDKYICVSKGVANHLMKQGIDKSKVEVIYNGIDIDSFDLPKEKQDVFNVGMVARFSKQKDQMTLIQAVEYLVKEKQENINLVLMGIGKTRKKCEEYIIKHNLNNNIKIIEGNIKELITKLDVFVLATHYEGFGLVLCEAMAAKVPVISTSVVGVKDEVIFNHKNGLLVNDSDKIDLVDKILQIKNNQELKNELVKNADIFVKKYFALNIMYAKYEKVIETI